MAIILRNKKGQIEKGNIPHNKGVIGYFTQSEISRKLISDKLKGVKKPPRSLAHRLNMSIAKQGKATNTGMHWKLSDIAKENISIGHRGEKSYSWKGGTTALVRIIRRCFKYRQWRSDIFTRDNFSCVVCFQRGGWIEADHFPKMFSTIFHENKIRNVEQALECEEFWNINNGRTLCRECHNLTKKL